MPELTQVLALVGPTASGKSALAVRLAQRLGELGRPAEIVNADSMLVYRGMDIGTAKPSEAERGGIPHHLIDVLEITRSATVADFQTMARAAIVECQSRGVLPIVVGGSALYVRAIVDEFEFPGTSAAVRLALEAEVAETGSAALHERLRRLDPAAAAAILPGNARRVVRALEVIELSGSYSSKLPSYTYALAGVRQFCLDLPRDELDRRIEARVERMWASGFVDEVRRLEAQGLRDGVTASRALGYRQVLAFLAGECSEVEAKAATTSGTRRFARKQLGWWRRDPRLVWLDAGGEVLETLLEACR